MEAIRVAVPLGIGDSWWSCQKMQALSAYHGGRPIEANVNSSPNHKSVGFLEVVPWIQTAAHSGGAPFDINNQMDGGYKDARWSHLEGCAAWRGYDYLLCANGHLERGEHLDTWLPELDEFGGTTYDFEPNIAADVREDVYRRYGRRRVLVYLSGVGPNLGFHNYWWSTEHWAITLREMAAAGLRPLIVGANTSDDLAYVTGLRNLMNREDIFDVAVGETSIPGYLALIQDASVWVGLNSGGGIVGASMNTPVVMLWSDHRYAQQSWVSLHANMQRGWLGPHQLETYRTLSFGSPELTPEAVVEKTLEVKR